MTTYEFKLSIGHSGAEHLQDFTIEEIGKGYSEDEWDKLGVLKYDILQESWNEWIWEHIDGCWNEIT